MPSSRAPCVRCYDDDDDVGWLLQLNGGTTCCLVVGCADLTLLGGDEAPHWMQRSGDLAVFGCNGSVNTWQLKCEGDEWIGQHGVCTDVSPSAGKVVKVPIL